MYVIHVSQKALSKTEAMKEKALFVMEELMGHADQQCNAAVLPTLVSL